MADYVDMKTLKFLLKEVYDANKLTKYDKFKEYDVESFEMLLDSTKSFSDKFLKPFYKEMDTNPAHYKNGKIIVHPSVEKVMRNAGENGSIGSIFSYDDGGMQLPLLIHQANGFIAGAANNGAIGYPGLTSGAAHLIVTFGNDELKKRFTPKMISGDWGGTMCLTEPQAGSSLSDIITSAKKLSDGSYSIKGDKIFISGGDHDYCDNFVHLVLARIEGAPKGTKGISLFAVPKNNIDENHNVTDSNNVKTIGDFQKLGEKGFCTTHLAFGEKGVCKGWLVGAENKGLSHMFQMMNSARIDVGMKGASLSTAAYLSSLEYAKERPQGRRISSSGNKNIESDQVNIIEHPDVRRMLLFQECISQGSLALLLQCSLYYDLSKVESDEKKEKYHDLLEILTPIAKTYPAEKGLESISNGLQVLGGYGFCTDYDLEQYYRDIRIMSIYEGTTGIQSLDLMGRKIIMKNGESFKFLINEFKETIEKASTYEELKPYSNTFKNYSKDLSDTIMELIQIAIKGDHERYISDATIFMEYMSNVVIAWQWLKISTCAKEKIINGADDHLTSFYEKKIHAMKFYFKYELTRNKGIKEILLHPDTLTIPNKEKKIFI